MYCGKCGTKLEEHDLYCPICGAKNALYEENEKRTALVIRLQNGDSNAFDEIYIESQKYTRFVIRSVIKDDDLVEDVMQTVYMSVYQNIGSLKEPKKFRGWLKAIAYNSAVNAAKKESRYILIDNYSDEEDSDTSYFDNIESEDTVYLPEKAMEDSQFKTLIQGFLDELPYQQKIALESYYFEGKKNKEIAEELGISENTIKSSIRRGKAAFAKKVNEYTKKTGDKLYAMPLLPVLYLIFREEILSMFASSTVPTAISSIAKASSFEMDIAEGTVENANAESAIPLSDTEQISTGSETLSGATSETAATGTNVGSEMTSGSINPDTVTGSNNVPLGNASSIISASSTASKVGIVTKIIIGVVASVAVAGVAAAVINSNSNTENGIERTSNTEEAEANEIQENDEDIITVEPTGDVTEESIEISSQSETEEEMAITEDASEVSTANDVITYTILVIDVSDSMVGDPLYVQNNTAVEFCQNLINAEGTNYISIARIGGYASYILCDFTTDTDELISIINNERSGQIMSSFSGTFMDVANKFDNIEQKGTTKIIKNLVICSDGLPNEGFQDDDNTDGQYSSDDYYFYQEANDAYDRASTMKEKGVHIYTIGFFQLDIAEESFIHTISGDEVQFRTRFMPDLASDADSFIEGTDPSQADIIVDMILADAETYK